MAPSQQSPTPETGLSAGVVGGGTMGAGITAVLAMAGYEVVLVDVDLAASTAAKSRAIDLVNDANARGRLDGGQAEAARQRIASSTQIADISMGCAVLIEAVPEEPRLKLEVLDALELRRPELLATNTSGISIDSLASSLHRPERFLGLHFFNPVPAMRLVEVVVGAATDDRSVERALELVDRIDKTSIVIRDAPGFATTRLGMILGLEAIRMVQDGVADPIDIDRAMELGYRHPMGPLRLTDLIGLDVRLRSAENLERAFGDRFSPPELLRTMVQAGKLGRKSGQGFYDWSSSEGSQDSSSRAS